MGVCEDNGLQLDVESCNPVEHLLLFVGRSAAGVNEDACGGVFIPDDIGVFGEVVEYPGVDL